MPHGPDVPVQVFTTHTEIPVSDSEDIQILGGNTEVSRGREYWMEVLLQKSTSPNISLVI